MKIFPTLSFVFFALFVGTLTLVASGCATMLSGPKQIIRLDSFPTRSEVFINGKFAGLTPITLWIWRRPPPVIVLRHQDYADTQVILRRSMNPWTLPTAALFGAGLAIDGPSGAWAKYAEDDIVVPLLFSSEADMRLYDGAVILKQVDLEVKK